MNKNFTRPLYFLLVVLLAFGAVFQAAAQNKQISLEQALDAISKKYKTKFAYEHSIVQGKTASSASLKAKSVDEALKNVLYPNNLLFLYVSEGNYTIVSRDGKTLDVNAQANLPTLSGTSNSSNNEFYLSGQVTDEGSIPLPGVTIKSNGSNRVVTTDGNGKYSIFVPNTTTSISFSYLGYQTSNLPVTANTSSLNVSLTPAAGNQLQDVNIVSNGYQVLPKERSTGAAFGVTAKDLQKIPTPNVVQRLESLIPGVKVTLNSDNMFTYGNTQQGINSGTRSLGRSDYNMEVRGSNTLRGETFPLVVVDGAIMELDLSTLNPNDIANITFLKDAAAASIWGTRAANGVVVITTKKGQSGQAPQVSFSMTAAVANRPDLGYLNMMNSAQVIAYEQDLVAKNLIFAPSATTAFSGTVADATDLTFKLKAGTITQAAYDAEISRLSALDNRSQINDYLLRPSSNQQYNLSVTGGGKSSDYFYSASYSKENPYTRGTEGQRLTLTMNNNFKLFKIATLSANFRASFFKYKTGAVSLSSLFSPTASTFMPYNQLVDASGNHKAYSTVYYSGWVDNLQNQGYLNWKYSVLDEMDNVDNSQNENNYNFNLNLNVPVFKGLSANAFFANERNFGNTRNYYSEATFFYRNLVNTFTPIPTSGRAVNSIGLSPGSGILNNLSGYNNNYTLRGQLNYDHILGTEHQLTAIVGSEIRQTKVGQGTSVLYGYNTGNGISRPVNFFTPYATIQGSTQGIAGSPSQQDKVRRYLSYYSNVAYTYKGKYTLSGSARYDDYNNFGVDRKFRATPLWSSGLKWDVKKESFLNTQNWLNSLSIRATYGVNGNISTNTFPFTYISLGTGDSATGLPNASIIAPANPELRWEKTYVANLGVDFALLDNRLSGSVDVYSKRGKDLFYEFPINGTYGFTSINRNVASMSGNGVEFNLNGTVIREKDYEWNAGLNFAYNTNKITDTRFIVNSTFLSNPAFGSVPLDGYPNDKIFVFRNAGLDANGLTQVFDQNGNKVGSGQNVTSVDALVYAGRRTPPYFGSFNTSFRYKAFTLMAVATYQFGNVFMRPTISAYSSSRQGVKYDLHEDITKRWIKAGDEAFTNVPGAAGALAPTSLLRYQQSDINVLKGDYIRLRELALTYQVPVEQLKFIRSANVGFSVRNLGLLWRANKEGLDPDFVGGLSASTLGLPSPVSYNFSLNVNF
ncbi:SusC/RagA family TonB-linked outer membrane protein [Pedobacter sp. KACC 23697]|uniref:SusC/RagA family TonB-linked outer membrane protein n=1 Tax=Pedobacter sp. KACC 23697 TaxID=3149230 RepID=A0AAU7K8D0_9SPHI